MGKGFLKRGQISPGVLITLIIIVLILIVGAIVYVVVSDKFGNVASSSGVTITNPTGAIKTSEGVADPIFKQCQDACDSRNKAVFCDVKRTFNNIQVTCEELATNSQYAQYEVKTCPSICNPVKTPEQIAQESDRSCVTGLGGTWETPVSDQCPTGDGKAGIKLTPSDQPPTSGQICCI